MSIRLVPVEQFASIENGSTYINVVMHPSSLASGLGSWLADKLAPPLITGVVISFIASVMIARAMERFRGRRDHLNKAVDNLRTQLASIQRVGAEYWGMDRDAAKASAQEAEIQFLQQDVVALARVTAPELWASMESDGPTLIADLLSAMGGPEFGRIDRKADPQKVLEIAIRAANLSSRFTTDRHRYLSKAAWWEGGR